MPDSARTALVLSASVLLTLLAVVTLGRSGVLPALLLVLFALGGLVDVALLQQRRRDARSPTG